jgi:polygalacturonase
MKPANLLLSAVGLSALAWSLMSGIDTRAQPSAGPLPGATPSVDAIRFPTIQAAIDALPPTGGIVRLPAGLFEIGKPLRVTHGDVLLAGAGTATHLKNVNTQGEPAIRVQPENLASDSRAMLWRVKLADMRVTGNPHSGHGIEAVNVNELFKKNALVIGPASSRITVTGNNFSDSFVGAGLVKRGKDDLEASGITLDGTSDVAVSGNVFSGVTPKAVSAEGRPSRRVLFSNNVLANSPGGHGSLRDSRIGENVED